MTSIIKVDTIQTAAGGTPTASSLGIGGTIGQVVSTTKTDTFTTSSTSFTDITGMSLNITPTSTSSKILVTGSILFSGGSVGPLLIVKLLRGTTDISISTGASSENSTTLGDADFGDTNSDRSIFNHPLNFLDSPSSTSSTTYKLQCRVNTGSFFLNRRALNDSVRGVSTLTLMEVLA